MKQLIIKALIIILLASGSWMCTPSTQQSDEGEDKAHGLVYITREQFEAEHMQIGQAKLMTFQSGINCYGHIGAQPNGVAQINTLLPGHVETVQAIVGQKVKKGEVIALISSAGLIELQQQYIGTLAQMKKITADYERAKELYKSNIGSEKEFLNVESAYQQAVTDYNAYRQQLQRLNLDITKIEEGKIANTYPLVSPINGEMTQLNVVLGKYVEQQELIAEVVDASRLQLVLSVFEKDIPQLANGCQVQFSLPNSNQQFNSARLVTIARRVQDDTKAIECRATIDSMQKQNLIYKSYVQAQVITRHKEALGLPLQSVIKEGNDSYYFVVKEQNDKGYYLEKQQLNRGDEFNGFIEVKNIKPDERILLSGVYNLPLD
ncbi:efflux RND transporter periplasmic adaptor subunit [Carboxylicivirga sp. A043]|uniref:efflux RND transporter periplasmic adaptor subunit n=1 Tax=Carboxylicivirga litoralis TaxID=2816963 RepID=UPI0021CB782F|nr:efflux RND transporter periplasmic adaptor subunit [Carboxylicivirga sp. A043]MCU4157215.1 efflux RND transporter periplasmic adaptor subunit [Carboxylicivirga sp. A043]